MGELIAFKPAKGGTRFRSAPFELGAVVIFTGVRKERLEEREYPVSKAGEARRTRTTQTRRTGKSKGKAGAGQKK